MTTEYEHADEYEDDVEEEYDPDDELEQRDAYIAQLEQALGFRQAVHEEVASLEHSGYGRPDEEADGREEFEQDFEATLHAVERERGARLLDGEVQRMWRAANQAAEDPAVKDDADIWQAAKQAAGTLDSSDDIAAYIGERLVAPRQREEPSATVVDDDGNEKPGYDLDDSNQRAEAIDRLMDGEDIAGFDSTYSTIEGDD